MEKKHIPILRLGKKVNMLFIWKLKFFSGIVSTEQRHKNFLSDEINKKVFHPNFFLGIKNIKSSSSSPPVRKICKYLNNKLNSANYEKII